MVRKQNTNDSNVISMKRKPDDDIDALFRLPLAEFTSARNSLAARLKQAGRRSEADLVKALVKPSISAWAVNQLYWNHRDAFNQLIETGERLRQDKRSRVARKVGDLRGALDARREALAQLSDLATGLLQDAGHNPAPDTIRRITTTLEAMSVYASLSDGPRPGRLTHDVDPPGFESLASLIPSGGVMQSIEERPRAKSSQKSGHAVATPQRKTATAADARPLQDTRHAKIASAKASLQEARKLLTDAQLRQHSLEVAQRKAAVEAKQAEKNMRDAEERFEKARAASEDAAQRARGIADEVDEAAKVVEDASRTVEKASKELEKLFRESPAR